MSAFASSSTHSLELFDPQRLLLRRCQFELDFPVSPPYACIVALARGFPSRLIVVAFGNPSAVSEGAGMSQGLRERG